MGRTLDIVTATIFWTMFVISITRGDALIIAVSLSAACAYTRLVIMTIPNKE